MLHFRTMISKANFENFEVIKTYGDRAFFEDDRIVPDATSVRHAWNRYEERYGDNDGEQMVASHRTNFAQATSANHP
ncbi:MAG: hypothetical protein B7Y85_00915 [Brevundimonas sp. 32-68-21]|nr:MAG: hypothetical protein B7Y85_00915 [Brevundimonas sp. 32-68-21]